MSDFVNTADTIGDDEMCDLIIRRTVTEYKEARIAKVGVNAFANCTELTTVDIPNVVTISEAAFQNCSKLVNVDAPNVVTISDNAFSDCSKLTSINAQSATTTGKATFGSCKALENVCFPSLVEVQSNGSGWQYGSFVYCTALKCVDLPVCTKIDHYAFNRCESLTALILRNNAGVCNLVAITAFSETPIANGTGYIYVPSALVDGYKAATNWSTYADQIRAIEDYTVDGTIDGEIDETKI